MFHIQASVNPDSRPEIIANLHEGLRILDTQIHGDEVAKRLYGNTTRRAIMTFQRLNQLNETDGFVGEQTASRLNELLKERGAFNNDVKLDGQVLESPDNIPLKNAKVEAWGKNSATDALLATVETNEKGLFNIAFKEPVVQTHPDIFFKIFEANRLLADTKDKIEWHRADPVQLITIIVENGTATANEGSVSGKVVTKEGVPLSSVAVKAFDKGLDQNILLDEATTDKNGAYNIRYKITPTSGDNPDIEVRAFRLDDSGAMTELGHSIVKYNASTSETLDVIIEPAKVTKPPEFQRLSQDLRPHLGSLSFKDLQEEDGKEQVTYLANKTGWDARIIAMSVQADKLSAETGIPAEHYYALFRAGVPNDPLSLGKLTPQEAESILKKAADAQLIPKDNHISETVKVIGDRNISFLLNDAFASGVSSLNNMLALRLNDAQKRTFVEAAQTVEEDPKKFWSALKERGFDDATISKLQLDGKMGYLTNQNAPLMKRLYEAHDINDPVDLVQHGFYKPEAWVPAIKNDVPAGVSAGGYAQHLANQIALSYPTAVTAEMVNRDEVKLPGQVPKQEVHGFFTRHQLKFMLGNQPVKQWEGFGSLSAEAKVAAKTVERLYQLSPSNEAMTTLAKLGLTSALQIAKLSKEEFTRAFGTEFNSAEEAELTYNKASEVHSAVMNVATAYITHRTLPNVYALTGKEKKDSTDIVAYPTLEKLFGNMDYCACDHCKSVLSPAAYLVDLLQFLDLTGVPHEKQNPVDVLLKRRPDIQHIQLSCENTNTVLPYIDLVNEILEHYVVNGNLETFKGHDITEETQTADLLADPQFVIEAAYTEVKTKVYPHNLPFDYPLEALRLLFNAWGVSLTHALTVFRDATQARKERLNLNADEFRIFTDNTFHTLPEYFGEAPDLTIDALNAAIANGKTFSHRTGIAYEELVALLKTTFINPGIVLVPLLQKLPLSLVKLQDFFTGNLTDAELDALLRDDFDQAPFGGDVKQWLRNNQALIMGMITLTEVGTAASECNFADLQLRFSLPDNAQNALNELAYHKLHRFIRLWKKLGWSIDVTDKVVTILLPVSAQAVDNTNIDDVFTTLLARIASFKAAMEKLSAGPKKIPDFLSLWDATKTATFRQEQAARLLKMRVEDLVSLSAITGVDPLANDLENDLPSLIRFIGTVQALKKISLKIADLNYILRHKDDTGKLTPTEETLLKHVKLLRDALNAVDGEHSVAPDNADVSFAKTKMALVYDNAVVNEFFGLLTNEWTYTAPFITVEEGLPAKLTDADANLGYDPFKKELTYKGILSSAARTKLATDTDTLEIDDMSVVTEPADFEAFKTGLKAALQQLETAGADELNAFGADYPELKIVYETVKAQADPAVQTTALLNGILPGLVARLKTNTLRQALAGLLKAEAETVDVLTENKETVHAAGDDTQPVLFDFLQLQQTPVFSDNQAYSFYLDAPATDDYLVYAKAPENTVITLSVNGVPVINTAAVDASGEVKNAVSLRLLTGELHRMDLTVANLPVGQTVKLFWRTKGMAKTGIPAANISILQNAEHARNSLLRLQKAASLSRLLKLTPRELRYFASLNAETKNVLNELTTTDTISDADLHNVWNKLNAIVYFAGLKKETGEEENAWVQVLENPDALNRQGKSLLLGLTDWKQSDRDAVLTHFGLDLTGLSLIGNLQKVVEAMNLVKAAGHPASSVIAWSTGTPAPASIKEIKDAIRSAVGNAAFLETMQTISDPLRNKQRDALVSYVLYHRKPSAEVNTPDKLYEHFLIDVQMDACMKTSRIRQALSTVQLFVHRCLMNLEREVAPASIRAQHWQWMSRYRVWEANRKIFLYPENWLEPELRDGKSSFFRDLEGELLQADVTDELAETAFLNYLKKLDDVAQLEIAGLYLEENEQGNQNDDILHVIGRTNGNTRQYYYRRYEYGYWTPWDKITLNVEGDLVFPVVWKKRLFLFWLSVMEKPAEIDRSKSPEEMRDESLGNNLKVNVEMTMSWGENYKNKWTSPKSSDLTRPMVMDGITSFQRSQLTLYARKEKRAGLSEQLIFNINYNEHFHDKYYHGKNRTFTVTYTSKNSPPVIKAGVRDTVLHEDLSLFHYDLFRKNYEYNLPFFMRLNRSQLNANRIDFPSKDFTIMVSQPPLAKTDVRIETVLHKAEQLFDSFRLLPLSHIVENQWEAPFFYNDEQNTFFVKPDEVLRTDVTGFDGYYDDILIAKKADFEIAPLVEETVQGWPPKGEVLGLNEPVTNPWEWTKRVVNRNANFKKLISNERTFRLGTVTFGPGGKDGALNGNRVNGRLNF